MLHSDYALLHSNMHSLWYKRATFSMYVHGVISQWGNVSHVLFKKNI